MYCIECTTGFGTQEVGREVYWQEVKLSAVFVLRPTLNAIDPVVYKTCRTLTGLLQHENIAH